MSLPIVLHSYVLRDAERTICEEAGGIVEAAKLLGITRYAVKRRIIKLNIVWPRKIEGST